MSAPMTSMLMSKVSGKYVCRNDISGKWIGVKCGGQCDSWSRGSVAEARVLVVKLK